MQTYTNRRLIGQWMPRTLQDYDLSQTATLDFPGLILYQYKWHEIILPPTYAEFAQEDRELANAGLADYAQLLVVEDLSNKEVI